MYQKLTLFLAALGTFITGMAQWQPVAETSLRLSQGKRVITPQQYRLFQLDNTVLTQSLQRAPKEFTPAAKTTPSVLLIPMPDGSLQRFRIFESSVMEPELQKKFPEIKTFSGQGIDDPYATIRIDNNPYSGFHGRILSPNGDVYIDPYQQGNTLYYQSYFQKDFTSDKQFAELPVRQVPNRPDRTTANRTTNSAPCRGTQLSTYRTAVACTGEYAQAATGSATPSVGATLAAIITTVNRVTQVYERDLAIRFLLIGINNEIVFTDPATDPFDGNNDAFTLLNESSRVIDSAIGNANYDIGHTFSTGGGGLAYVGAVCYPYYKAGGITGSPNPVGDPYDVDYVAHEVGHQFGGNHTFRGTGGSCSGNANVGPAPPAGSYTAYEPGSGTTIMAYAGICGSANNMQPNGDPYFHAVSYDEIITYITTGDGNSCKGIISTGNNIPVITAMNFNGASIPANTPFTLSATATDADGDALTYEWEQWDVSLTANSYNSTTGYADGNAIWRSRVPTTDGKRTIPDIRRVAANYLPASPPSAMNGLKGEILPSVLKNYSFKLTVRDNHAGGGGIATGGGKPVDASTDAGGVGCSFTTPFSINVVTGTFAVTAPNGGETYPGGTLQTVTWDNTGTTSAPVSCANVRITLSTDGGLTYPLTVLASTPNDGSQQVAIPNVNPTTTMARMRVEAADNIFFDISNQNFTIQYNAVLPVNFTTFTVKAQGKNAALLNWATADERDNAGFTIERSIGSDASFTAIGSIASGGNGAHEYRYVNEALPLNTAIYFRLKQTDRSGQSKFSETRMVRFNDERLYLSLQPNPAQEFVTLINSGEVVAKATVEIFDATGRAVKRVTTPLQQTTRLNLTGMASGVYSIRVMADNKELLTTKLIKE